MNASDLTTMYHVNPVVSDLNKVPGFDPLKYVRETKDGLKLDLPYKKLWFRLKHPNGIVRPLLVSLFGLENFENNQEQSGEVVTK